MKLVSFLLMYGIIIGRFIWGSPTYACLKSFKVKVSFIDLPLP